MMINNLFLSLFMTINMYTDIKKRSINCSGCIVFGLIALFIKIYIERTDPFHIMISIIPGVFFVIISLLTRQAIGMGDGITLIVIGIFIGTLKIYEVFFAAMFISSLVAIVLLIFKKANKKDGMPYMPFLTIACLLVMCL